MVLREGLIYVPDDLDIKRTILQSRHDALTAGHPGQAKTLELVTRDYYWPQMTKFVNKYVETCDSCARTKSRRHAAHGQLQPLPVPQSRWTDISYDFITELPKSNGYDAILVVVDRLTKMSHFIPTTTKVDAEGTALLFRQHVWKHHGTPERTVSDRGTVFNSKFLKALYELLGIKPLMSTAYHPQTDGQTERVNQNLEQYLRLYTTYLQDDWSNLLDTAEFTYNNTEHSSTGMTPFFANYGYHPRVTPSPVRSSVPAAETLAKDLDSITKELKAMITLANERHARFYDRNHPEAPSFKEGDKVWLSGVNVKTMRPSKKLDDRRLGPFTIKSKKSDLVFELALPATMNIHPVFHATLLEPHKGDPIPGRVQPPPPPIEVEGEEEYEVEKILDSRWIENGSRFQYRVKWVGYPSSENSWEPPEFVTNSSEEVTAYHTRYPSKPRPDQQPAPKPPRRSRPRRGGE